MLVDNSAFIDQLKKFMLCTIITQDSICGYLIIFFFFFFFFFSLFLMAHAVAIKNEGTSKKKKKKKIHIFFP